MTDNLDTEPKTITRGNWSMRDAEKDADRPSGLVVCEGDTITGGNFSQHTPGTEIMKGIGKLTITGGNFVNVKRQPTWTVTGGNWHQVERCSHVHPEWVARHGLPACADACEHRSAEREWVEVDVKDFREAKASLSAKDVKIEETPDADGVREQKFSKFVYTYEDKAVS